MPDLMNTPAPGDATLSPLDPAVEAVSTADDEMAEAVRNLRSLILAGERYRQTVSSRFGLGQTESQAMSYLAVHGQRGQSDLASDLALTTSALTALVDRLERLGLAERTRHPTDRRRLIVRLTERGEEVVTAGQDPLRASLGVLGETDLTHLSTSLELVARGLREQTDQAAGARRPRS